MISGILSFLCQLKKKMHDLKVENYVLFGRLSEKFPGGSAGAESTCSAGDLGLITGLGRSPGEGKGYPLWYSGLGNSMDCVVHEIAKSQTRLCNFHFTSLQLK